MRGLTLGPRACAIDDPMLIVRLLLFLALGTIIVAALVYFFTRDRRYLRFIVQVAKFTVALLVGTMLFYAFERLVLMA